MYIYICIYIYICRYIRITYVYVYTYIYREITISRYLDTLRVGLVIDDVVLAYLAVLLQGDDLYLYLYRTSRFTTR